MLKPIAYLSFMMLLVFSLGSSPGRAQEALTLDVEVGFDSFYKAGTWTPVRVKVSNNSGATLHGRLQFLDDRVNFGTSKVLYVYPIELPGQSQRQVTLYLPLRGQHQVRVELQPGQDIPPLTRQIAVTPLTNKDALIGVVAGNPSLLTDQASFATPHSRQVSVAHLSLDELPLMPAAWSSLDLLVFNDVDTSQLSPVQQRSLETWVHFGGRLFVGGGPNAAQTIAGLGRLLPFSAVAEHTLPHPVEALQWFTQGEPPDRGPYIVAAPIGLTGQTPVQENGVPLFVSQPRGQGTVYYLAFDLGLAPFDAILAENHWLAGLAGSDDGSTTHLTRQLDSRTMLNSLAIVPDQPFPSPQKVVTYLVIYVLVIGPLNYLVLSLLKKKDWAWVTVPIIIFSFTAYGYIGSFRLRSGRPLLRQITVLQSDTELPQAEAVTYAGIYSPFRATHTLTANRPVLLETLGEQSLLSQLKVTLDETTTVENIRGDVGSLTGVAAYYPADAPPIEAALTIDLARTRLAGKLINKTGRPITGAYLIFNNRVGQLNPLPAGETRIDQPVYDLNSTPQPFYPWTGDDTAEGQRERLRQASREGAVRALVFDSAEHLRLPGNQLYLVGWQEGGPVDFQLNLTSYDKMSETLLLVKLPEPAERR